VQTVLISCQQNGSQKDDVCLVTLQKIFQGSVIDVDLSDENHNHKK